jgi:thiol:disulfide interchange protein DsbD
MPLVSRIALGILLASALHAQDPVQWTVHAPSASFRAGDTFTVEVTATIDPAWHIYSVTQPRGGPFPTRITLADAQPFRLAGTVTGPPPKIEMDSNFGIQTETHAGTATFRIPVQVAAAAAGQRQLEIRARYQACDATNCLPPRTDELSARIVLLPGGKAPSTPQNSITSFLWLAMTMGALSLLTPCVFPMVPITVSYFTSHAAASRSRAVRDAAIYAAGIILTFTALGLALAVLFGAAGINKFAANPWINLAITAIFLAFALSLLGAFELTVSSRVLTSLDALSRSKDTGKILALLLMGLTFSLTSFTCTAPFVGTLLVMASQGQWLDPALGMLAFSTVFAAPFFALALAPHLVSQLPRAGGWMSSVKVVMGLLEIAAAMKFLSNADLVWRWGIFTRDVVLAVWIAVGILIVVYVLGWVRLPLEPPVRRRGIPRLATAAGFLVVTLALTAGLFGRRLGELDSFLPPAPEELSGRTADGLHWIINDYAAAREQARRDSKLLFVDFTGYTCTNCRWMEANIFPRAEVRAELEKFVTVRLYTDGEGRLFERQQRMQQDLFRTVALPLYAIIRADGSPLATFPGLTRNPAEFLTFLRTSQ